MKRIGFLLVAVKAGAGVAVSLAQASGNAGEAASPIYGALSLTDTAIGG